MTIVKNKQANSPLSQQKKAEDYLRHSRLCFASAFGIGVLTSVFAFYAYAAVALIIIVAFAVFAIIFALMLLTAGFYCREYGLLLKQH